MKLSTITDSLCAPKIIQVRTAPEHRLTKAVIHASARIAQVSFAFGCLSSGVDIAYRLLQIITGASVLLQGVHIMAQVVTMGIYHDLAKISSNIASIFKSEILLQYAKNSIGTHPYGKVTIQTVEDCEKGFSLPDSEIKNLNNARGITNAATYGTLVAFNFNPHIEQFLDRKL